uniref:t-SNARE coiled-coil homology domain-containing protein n=1 Tax=Photinus pyralis TaxID=7054 RepID=A0A1Y1MB27_PHOPY
MSPTKDRLNDLKKIQNGEVSVLLGVGASDKQTTDINTTLTRVDKIRENIEIIRHNTLVSDSIFQSNSFKLTAELQDQIDSLFQSTTTASYKINKQLKEFENELDKIKEKSSAKYRINQTQYNTLKGNFRKALAESSSSLEIHRNNRKNVLKKCLKLVHEEADDEQLEALLDSNKLDVFTENHLVTTEEARRQLHDIEERHEELLKIEKNLEEVMGLFVTIATLVDQQQELVDRVEFHASSATDYVEQGTHQLEKTIRSKKKWNKRKFYFIIAIIILLLIIIIILCL